MKQSLINTIQRKNSIKAGLLMLFGLWLGVVPADAALVTYNPTFPAMNLKVGGSSGTEDMSGHFYTNEYGNQGMSYSYSITAGSGNISVSRSGSTLTISPVAVGSATVAVTATHSTGFQHSVTGNIKVRVRPDNSPPEFSTSASQSVAENSTTVVTVKASDFDSQDSITGYSISGGDDSGKFSIVASTGALSFSSAPDYENPGSSATPASNTYKVTVKAKSGAGAREKEATQDITVTVTNVNEKPVPVGTIAGVTISVGGNDGSVDVSSYFSDPDGDTLTYTVSSSDAAKATASVSSSTVTIKPVAAGSAKVTVTASDGSESGTQTISVTVKANTAPTFSSEASKSVAENTTTVVTVKATDSDSDDDIGGYSIKTTTGSGADHGKFSITTGGALTFSSAPDYEDPDSDADSNVYEVTVEVKSGTGDREKKATQDITVTVTDVNETPVAEGTISAVTISVDGNDGSVDVSSKFSDPDADDTLTYTVSSSDTAKATATVSSSTVTIAPVAAGTATITVTATDDGSLSAKQDISVTVKANSAPTFTSSASVDVAEDTTTVVTVKARDSENEDTIGDFSIKTTTGSGADHGKFSITTGGALTFSTAPDYEDPDSDADSNVYKVTVEVESGTGDREKKATQDITVTVTNVNETPVAVGTISAVTINEGGADGSVDVSSKFSDPDSNTTLTYTASSSDTAKATVSVASSTVTIKPVAAGSATVTVTASDGSLSATQTISVTVKANTAPTFSSEASKSVAENTTTVITVTATDSETEDTIGDYSLKSGADKDKFSITTNGALSFSSAPDFETPDSDADSNVYKVTVEAQSGTGDRNKKATQDITVTVTDVNEKPVAEGTISAVTISVDGNDGSVDVSSKFSDPDADDTLTYTVSSSDTAKATATVSSSTVTIAPVAAGTATITVTATDDGSLSAKQDISVTVKANSAPTFTSSASVDVAEDTTTVVTVKARDSENEDTIGDFSIKTTTGSGADHGKFSITTGGALSFSSAPDYEDPDSDADSNVYKVTVEAQSGTGDRNKKATQDITVTVTNVNETPVAVGTIAAVTINEGGSDGTVDVSSKFSDPDSNTTLTYTASSSDTAKATASVSSSTVTIKPKAAGTATVTVTASDGSLSATQTIAVTVKANTAPTFTSSASVDVAENTTTVVTVTASDSENEDTIGDYSIKSGADKDKFSITTNGALSFSSAPDFETPDSDADSNVYKVTVEVESGTGDRKKKATQDITVTVTDVNETPVAEGTISAVTISVDGNDGSVDVSSKFSDPDSDTLTYTVSSSDTAKASVSGSTVTIAPVAAGTATVTVTASDGSLSATQDISVTVKANTAPTFTSSASVDVAENSTAVVTVTATDSESEDAIGDYSISDSDDSGKFSIVASTGDLSFSSAPNYESPGSSKSTNVYKVTVKVSSGSGDRVKDAEQDITVTVTDVNERPYPVGSISGVVVNEDGDSDSVNVSSKFSDPDRDTLSYTASSSKATVATASVSGSTVTIAPVSAGTATVTVTASDGSLSATQNISVTVKANTAPTFSSSASVNAAENQTAVVTVTATDSESEDSIGDYSINGGNDSGKFSITTGGVLSFKAAPNFESPGSSKSTNVYKVSVEVESGTGDRKKKATQGITVTVTDVNETPEAEGTVSGVIVNEDGDDGSVDVSGNFSDPDGDTLSYAVSSDKASVATATVASGTVTISPVRRGTATVTVTASDSGGLSAVQTIAVTVKANDAPAFSNSGGINVAENTTVVITVTGSDSDSEDSVNGYSISGGADGGKFAIVASTGDLSFKTAPNFERRGSADGTNEYKVTVWVESGAGDRKKTETQDITVTVTDVNEAPEAVGTISAVTVNEDGDSHSVDVSGKFSDPDGDSLTYRASSSTGSVARASVSGSTITIGPMAPGSATVTVTASDGSLSAVQTIDVTVRANKAPAFSSAASVKVPENSTLVITVKANDNDDSINGYSIDGGADSGQFSIGSSSGVLSFNTAPDYERPGSSAGTNVYAVEVKVSSGAGDRKKTAAQTLTVTVTDVNEAPEAVAKIPSVTLNEGGNSHSVDVLGKFSDPDGDVLSYTALSSAVSVAAASVSKSTVTIAPVSAGTAKVTVTASDPDGLSAKQTISVTVRPNIPSKFIGGATFSVAENTTVVGTITATDDDDSIAGYSINGGADGDKFSIGLSSGVLSFSSAPDYENPASDAGTNVYEVIVQAESGTGDRKKTATQNITVTVTDVNEAPEAVGTIAAVTVHVDGNDGSVDVSGKFSDPDGDVLSYTASSNAVSVASVSVSNSTVTIAPVTAGIATVTVTASDGSLNGTQTIAVTVKANSAPAFSSSSSVVVAENTTPVLTVRARDADDSVNGYSIIGGADGGKFSIVASTGALSFKSAPDFESPGSAVGTNVYGVEVEVSSGRGDRVKTAAQAITVTVTDVNEAPEAVGTIAGIVLNEHGNSRSIDVQGHFSDPDGDTLTYTASSSKISVAAASVSGSTITISPVKAGASTVTVTASDSGGLSAAQTIFVRVRANKDLVFSGSSSVFVAENTTTVVTIKATDSDDSLNGYSISGGVDSGQFAIDSTSGMLSFKTAPDFEAPADASGDNDYIVEVQVSSGTQDRKKTATRLLTVTVTDVNEAPEAVGLIPAVTVNVDGNDKSVDVSSKFIDPDGDALSYAAVSDKPSAAVSVSGSTITISPVQAGVGTVTVTASDPDGLQATQTISVTVRANSGPVFSSLASVSVPENTTTVIAVTASDAEDSINGYSIIGGADGGKFSIVASTGDLSFNSAPNFESPGSVASTNAYKVSVQVSSGSGDRVKTAEQDITVTVIDVNEAPIAVGTIAGITISVDGDDASVEVSGNFTDPDGDALSYAASSDKAAVTTASVSGSTITISAVGGGTATVAVTASDPGGLSAAQTISVKVRANSRSLFIGATTFSVPENTTAVGTIKAADSDDNINGYSISGGADGGQFSIGFSSGALSFKTAPDFESPGSAAGTNVYAVEVQASSGRGDRKKTAAQVFTVTVTDVNEAPFAVGTIAGVVLNEYGDSISVDVLGKFSDPDGDTLSYTASSDDTASATVNVSVSTVTITPAAAGGATVTVTASDSDGLSAAQTIGVTVMPNNDPVFSSLASVSVPENTIAVVTVTAADSDDSVNGYSISGGADGGQFDIDSISRVLSFRVAPDFEAPSDASGDNGYAVEVRVSSGSGDRARTATQRLTVTVTDVNETPKAVGTISGVFLNENGNSGSVDVSAHFSDPDGDALSYAASSDKVSVASVSVLGSIVIIQPSAAGTASVTVTASDPDGLSAVQTIAVTVLANKVLVFSGSEQVAVPENTIAVVAVKATDSDDSVNGYSISGGADGGQFAIDSISGILSFKTAPDFEAPSDASKDNGYVVEVQVSSGTGDRAKAMTQALTVTVTDVNEAPVAVGTIAGVTLNNDGNSISVDVLSYFSDPDGDALTYTASSSAVAAATASVLGSVVMITPAGVGKATVTVTASDGSLTATQTIAVTVEPVANHAPTVRKAIGPVTLLGDDGSSTTVDVSGNFSDKDGDALTYTIVSSDTSVAVVSVSGDVITITSAGVGTATITVTATDSSGLEVTQTFTVTVEAAPNRSPVVEASIKPVTLAEGQASVWIDVSDNFSDPDGDGLTYTAASSDTGVVAASVSGDVVTITSVGLGTGIITVTATDSRGLTVTTQISAAVVKSDTARYRTELLPNYPNPFNPETWIPYRLAESANVTVTIYDVNGHLVRILKIGFKEAGDYTNRGNAAYWDGKNSWGEVVTAGVYFYNLTTSDYSATLRASVMK